MIVSVPCGYPSDIVALEHVLAACLPWSPVWSLTLHEHPWPSSRFVLKSHLISLCKTILVITSRSLQEINISLQVVDLDGYAMSNHVVIFLHLDVNLKEKGRNAYSLILWAHNFFFVLSFVLNNPYYLFLTIYLPFTVYYFLHLHSST